MSKEETLRKRGRYGDFVVELPLSYKHHGQLASDFWKHYDEDFQMLAANRDIDLKVKILECRLGILKKNRDNIKKQISNSVSS